MKNWSLKAKLLSVVAGTGAIALVVALLLAKQSQTAVRVAKESALHNASENLLDTIDRNLFERYGDVQAFAVSEPARSGDAKRIVPFMTEMMQAYAPIYQVMMVVNGQGKVVAVNQVDKSGATLDTSRLVGKDVSGEEWFKKCISGDVKPGSAHVADLHLDQDVAAIYHSTGKVMSFSAPIRSADGNKILGVWSNRMSWADVIETITKEKVASLKSDSMPVVLPYIVNAEGKFLLHPEGEKFELSASWSDFESTKKQMSADHDVVFSKVTLNNASYNGEMYQASHPSEGYGAYAGLGWIAFLQVPVADPLLAATNKLVAGALVAVLFALALAFLFVRSLAASFQRIIASLGQDSQALKGSSDQLNDASQRLASSATQAASSLQETASSIEEISSMVNKTADSADNSIKLAHASQETAGKGKRTIDQMIQSINEISASNTTVMNQVEQTTHTLTEIIKVISDIGTKTKVINEIVFQTKLLSFNASVEAARAGEHGKGFAVVAEEVGNLAQMSGNAAKEIGDMLNDSIRRVQSIVDETKGKVDRLVQDGKGKIEEGIRIARDCGEVLEEIVRSENEVSTIVGEISTASQEQAQGVSEINKAMNQLDQATHSNATVANQTSQYAQEIDSKSNTLKSNIDVLTHIVFGNKSPVVAPAINPATSTPAKANPAAVPGTPAKVIPFPKKDSTAPSKGSAQAIPAGDDPRFVEL